MVHSILGRHHCNSEAVAQFIFPTKDGPLARNENVALHCLVPNEMINVSYPIAVTRAVWISAWKEKIHQLISLTSLFITGKKVAKSHTRIVKAKDGSDQVLKDG